MLVVVFGGYADRRGELAIGLKEEFCFERVKLEPAAPSPGDKVGGNTVQVPSPVTDTTERKRESQASGVPQTPHPAEGQTGRDGRKGETENRESQRPSQVETDSEPEAETADKSKGCRDSQAGSGAEQENPGRRKNEKAGAKEWSLRARRRKKQRKGAGGRKGKKIADAERAQETVRVSVVRGSVPARRCVPVAAVGMSTCSGQCRGRERRYTAGCGTERPRGPWSGRPPPLPPAFPGPELVDAPPPPRWLLPARAVPRLRQRPHSTWRLALGRTAGPWWPDRLAPGGCARRAQRSPRAAAGPWGRWAVGPSGRQGSASRDQAAQMRAPLCLLLLVAHAVDMLALNRRKKQASPMPESLALAFGQVCKISRNDLLSQYLPHLSPFGACQAWVQKRCCFSIPPPSPVDGNHPNPPAQPLKEIQAPEIQKEETGHTLRAVQV
ncbi:hypothetical protein P7K49_009485 [Saguinus oedipus]|uniref:Uncharacterized protein n=1 Tax=Saguinus oedipus TaxID=9490 RepID=A0ABQ9VK33_SAGOE|nr:hypothetical protein P7K49_009485 [Saguinus oedipus]